MLVCLYIACKVDEDVLHHQICSYQLYTPTAYCLAVSVAYLWLILFNVDPCL